MNVLQIKRGNFADLPTGADRLKPGEMYFAEDVNTFLVGKNDQSTAQFIGDGVKKYVARITQTGTNAPVATVLENTLDGTLTWSRSGVGIYDVTLVGKLTLNKTVVFITNNFRLSLGEKVVSWTQTNGDTIVLATTSDGSAADDIMSDSNDKYYIEIRVYP